MILDLKELCRQHGIKPLGVIHIGAHEGTELTTYREMGICRVLFIEANPAVFERLKVNVAGAPGVDVVSCAVSDHDGVVTLHVTSMDQSSSILPLKRHKEIYPNINETHQITVQSKKLDTLFKELKLSPLDFNILNIDIQGAELLAFQGAINVLKHIEAINTEVNYEELYEGCALIDQMDEFLDRHGFERVATTTPYHPSWGDAFYVKKPVITMSTLGINGRFANQIFQYAFLKIYAKVHNLKVETPEWIGQYLFGHNDPPISHKLPEVRIQPKTDYLADSLVSGSQMPFKNVDFGGYFQYHTKYYAPHKEYFRSLFKPVRDVEDKMNEAISILRSKGKTVVGLHIRRKDYGYGPFFIAPTDWYKEWLTGIWDSLNEPVLFIASDEPKKVISDFADYKPMIVKDLGIELPKAEFYPDFYLMSQCDIVAISNSSYSFAACMLNENCKLFLRPHLPSKKLIPFDPWNSDVLLYDQEILQSAQDHLQKGNLKQAQAICKEIIKTHPYDVIRFASICMEKSQQFNLSSDNASYILGMALQEIGGTDVAIHFYQKTLQLNPNHNEAYNHLENAIREKRRLNKEAISCYKNQYLAELCKNKFDNVYKENYQFLADRTFIVCAMFTPNKPRLFQYANRLISSCEKYKLPYIIYEAPSIHKSITPQGQEDSAFTKANFIYSNMLRFPTKNILYLDIDVFFIDYPDVIVAISKAGYDFAIYNWLNDEHNEAYIPINRKIESGNVYSDFYMFSHCIGYCCNEQLICSGAVQFYKNSVNAKHLLESWQTVISNNPDYADDECLDYAFNNFILDLEELKPFWLDKPYCRYPWWPHIKPVILHPDLPFGGRSCHLTEINNRQRFYPGRCQPKSNLFLFSPDYIIDTKNRLLLKIINNQITDIKTIKQDFWIYPEDIELT